MFSLYYDVMLDFNKLRFWESEIRYVYLLYLAYYLFYFFSSEHTISTFL